MKKLKKSLAFITTISMLATLAACNSDNKDSSKEESTVETTAEITTEAVTEEETTEAMVESTEEFSVTNTFITNFIQNSLEKSFDKEDIKIEYEEKSNSYIISTCHEDILASIIYAKIDSDTSDAWNELVDAYVILSNNLFDYLQAFDNTASLTLNLTTDKTNDAPVLTVHNGEITYNLYDTLDESVQDKQTPSNENNNSVIYEDEIVQITYTGIEKDLSFGWTDVKLTIENKSDKKICVQDQDVSINGVMTDPIFSCEITKGKKANDIMTFTHLEEDGIDKIETIELSFHIFDYDSRDTIIDTEPITIDVSK